MNESGVEAGLFLDSLNVSQSYRLPNGASVFTVEIFAIWIRWKEQLPSSCATGHLQMKKIRHVQVTRMNWPVFFSEQKSNHLLELSCKDIRWYTQDTGRLAIPSRLGRLNLMKLPSGYGSTDILWAYLKITLIRGIHSSIQSNLQCFFFFMKCRHIRNPISVVFTIT